MVVDGGSGIGKISTGVSIPDFSCVRLPRELVFQGHGEAAPRTRSFAVGEGSDARSRRCGSDRCGFEARGFCS